MTQLNELSLFTFHSHPLNSGFYAPAQVDEVEYCPFRSGGRDGLIWRSQGVWLMVEAAPHIAPGGLVTGEQRRLLVSAAGFAPDPETKRMMPQGPLMAEYSDLDELPGAVALIVTAAARHHDFLEAEANA